MKNAKRISGVSVLVLSYFAAAGAHALVKRATADAAIACVVAIAVLAFGAGIAWGRRRAA